MTPKPVNRTLPFLGPLRCIRSRLAVRQRTLRACTTAVISGQATANGRPLLWKNRDADNKQNQVVYDATGRYPFVGVVNSADPAGLDIWAGINSQGFAIMNSASYNLDKGDSLAEGQLMRLALQSCATVAEFQALLDKTDGGRDVMANFGVIDANGRRGDLRGRPQDAHALRRHRPQGRAGRVHRAHQLRRLGQHRGRLGLPPARAGHFPARRARQGQGARRPDPALRPRARRRQRAHRFVPCQGPAGRRALGLHRRQRVPVRHRLGGAVRGRRARARTRCWRRCG